MAIVEETRTNKMWLDDEEGILHFQYFPGVEITLEDAREVGSCQQKLLQGKKRPVLGDIVAVKSVTRKARDYFAGVEFQKCNLAMALLVSSPVSKVIGNIFIAFNKPSYPTRLFTSKSKALEWLKTFIR